MIDDFHFLRPAWLLVPLLVPLLLWAVARENDVRERFRRVIAPHLLDRLIVDRRTRRRLRPVHLTAASIAIGAVAVAGPTWQRERPPFVEDEALLVIAVDLSATMNAIDVAPTRLTRAKLKIRDLLDGRGGARTALFAYGGSAHCVVPLTDDRALLQSYVDALATDLMPVPGKDTANAVRQIEKALAAEHAPATILFVTDGIEPAAFPVLAKRSPRDAVLVLGIGTEDGGPVKTADGDFLNDATGARLFAKLDVAALKELHSRTGIPVATVTPDDSDISWVAHHIEMQLRQKQTEGARWKDAGWYLVIPIVVLSALWFRRGWTIRWTGAIALVFAFGTPQGASAYEWRDAFVTADQEGRLAFERGDFTRAAERFSDPMWKGVAFYRAGRWQDAVDAFARVDSAESWFDQGNALARMGKLELAVASYERALARHPGWSAATQNVEIVRKLIAAQKKNDEEDAQDPNQKPDELKFDEHGKKGKAGRVDAPMQSSEVWMRNIQMSPALLLKRKFQIEAARSKEVAP